MGIVEVGRHLHFAAEGGSKLCLSSLFPHKKDSVA